MITLNGITWRHSRALPPLVAASQVQHDRGAPFNVEWQTRSLLEFDEGSLDDLVQDFDLVVVDHPMIGDAVVRGLLRPLDDLLPADVLQRLADQSIGACHRSYRFQDSQWAVAIDGAAQTAVWRPDRIGTEEHDLPLTWVDVLQLARTTGRVALPLRPIDALSTWFSLCATKGAPPGRNPDAGLVDEDIGVEALVDLRELANSVDRTLLHCDPIAVLNRMSGDDVWDYCPVSYCYSNYSRPGYVHHPLEVGPSPSNSSDAPIMSTTLGGAGLAVTSGSPHPEMAAGFAAWVGSNECQCSTYMLAGGQPAIAAAWESDIADAVAPGFFRSALTALEAAYLRPNLPGFPAFQVAAGRFIHAWLDNGRSEASEVFRDLEQSYRSHISP